MMSLGKDQEGKADITAVVPERTLFLSDYIISEDVRALEAVINAPGSTAIFSDKKRLQKHLS